MTQKGARSEANDEVELAVFGPPSELQPSHPLVRGRLPRRIYVGNEFCERLSPSAAEVHEAIGSARQAGLLSSVVLPYVGPAFLAHAMSVLETVAHVASGTEIIANDWGILRRVASEARLTPVMGRCLQRTSRDPRLPVHIDASTPPAACEALTGGPFRSSAFAELCRRYRVSRLEIDLPPLGLGTECFGPDLPLSLYVPFGFVASGRICLFAAAGRRGDRFTPGPCHTECTSAALSLSAPPDERGPLALELRGNTIFYRHDAGLEALALAAVQCLPIDRVVWQRDAPMWPGGGTCRDARKRGSVRP